MYNGYGDETGRGESGAYVNINGRDINMNKWYIKVLPVAILLLIVVFFFWVVFGLLHLTFSILFSPVFWVIVIVCLALSFFSRRR